MGKVLAREPRRLLNKSLLLLGSSNRQVGFHHQATPITANATNDLSGSNHSQSRATRLMSLDLADNRRGDVARFAQLREQ